MKMSFVKTSDGRLSPFTDADNFMSNLAVGDVATVEISKMRNGRFFRKWWVLANVIFDFWSDNMPKKKYKGVEVEHSFERFRKDLIIQAGYYSPVFDINGNCKLEAQSIAWSKMDEEKFSKLYSATIQAGLNIMRGWDENKLRNHIEELLSFA